MTISARTTTRVLTCLGAATVMVTLAGCGGGGEPAMPSRLSTTASVTARTPQPEDGHRALLKAAETAQRAVADSTVISIESERADTQWEVQVVTSDGTEHEVEVAADGTTIISGPSVKSETAQDKAKHRSRVQAAKLDYRQAVSAVTRVVPGRVTELNLDSHNEATVWEADVIDSGGTKHEVRIDAGSGKVVTQN